MKEEIKKQLQKQGYSTVSEMASELGINISTLNTYLMKKTTPISPSLDKTIYSDTLITVSEIESKLGIKNSSTFEEYLNKSKGKSLEEISSEKDKFLANSKKVKK
jgi:hypothetical protein